MRKELTFAVLLVVGLSVAPATVVAQKDPNFDVTVPEPTLAPGQSTELTLLVTNDAEDVDEEVETAENVEVELDGGDTPITVQSGPRRLGTMADGDSGEVAFRITVPQDIASGTHELSLRITYEHDGESKSQTVDTIVRVEDRARFDVVDTATAVSIGETGTYELTVRNIGSETARAASVRLESGSGHVTFGQSAADTRFVGTLAPGEEATIVFSVAVAEEASQQSYGTTATISYEDGNGIRTTAPPKSVGLTPTAEHRFSLEAVNASLRVGEEGALKGELVNAGDERVRNLVLTFEPSSPTLTVTEPEVAIGDLGPGERAAFAFEVDVASSATAGPRLFTLVPSFRDADDRREGDSLDLRVAVGPKRNAFHVAGSEAAFAAGERDELVVEVTNNRDHPVTDVSAKLFTKSPLSTDDDEAFISELAPGESETIIFDVAVGDSALAKTYPVEIDFRYRTVDGETRLSDTYNVPVQVTRQESDGLGPIVFGGIVVALVVVGLAAYLLRRRARRTGSAG